MRTAIFLCILLHGAALAGAELHVESPLVQVVHSRDKLRTWCRVDGHYDACTIFICFRTKSSCVDDLCQSMMKVATTSRPWIFLPNLSRLPHEHEHLQDLAHSVDGYLTVLERMRFTTSTDCKSKVLGESA